MIDRPPENKSLAPARPANPADIRKAREDFARTVDPPAGTKAPAPPAGPKVVGHGTCPGCRVDGDIWIEGEGTDRHLRYVGCRCAR